LDFVGKDMKLSVVIPAHNEPELRATVEALTDRLLAEKIDHEVLIVNDHSTDDTENVSIDLYSRFPSVRYLNNPDPPGFGLAVRYGLENFKGDAVAVYMADASDLPEDLASRYLFIVLYCFIEKWLSSGDYHSSRIANDEKSVPRFSR